MNALCSYIKVACWHEGGRVTRGYPHGLSIHHPDMRVDAAPQPCLTERAGSVTPAAKSRYDSSCRHAGTQLASVRASDTGMKVLQLLGAHQYAYLMVDTLGQKG